MRSAARLLPLGLLAALLATLAAGCGGATLDPVASAATKTVDAGSFRFALSLTVGAGGESREALSGEGAWDADARRLRATIGAGDERLEAVADLADAPAVYVRPPDATHWQKVDLAGEAKRAGVDLGSLTTERLDPRDALEALQRAGDSTKVGEETIDGVETTRYRVAIDARKALQGRTADERRQAERALSLAGLDELPLDVWVDRDGLLRRVAARFGGDDALFAFGFRLDLSDYGADVHVELPPPGEVADQPPRSDRRGG